MKRMIFGTGILLFTFIFIFPIKAYDTSTLKFTIEPIPKPGKPKVIAISLTDVNGNPMRWHDYGTVEEGGEYKESPEIIAKNEGNVTEDFKIQGSYASPSGECSKGWALVQTDSPSTDEFSHEFSLNGTNNWTFLKHLTPIPLQSNVKAGKGQSFWLQLKPPSSISPESSCPQTTEVTVFAYEH